MTDHILIERPETAPGVQVIRLNRVEKKNALTRAMYQAMTDALKAGDADESVRAGTHGYLLKDSAATDLRAAVRAVMAGESFFSPELSQPRAASVAQHESPITRRERQVLVRVAAGGTNKEIAADLGISHRTVETHRESIARKLGISSVAGQTRYVIEHHLTDD